MGIVFEAEQVSLGRRVALKVLPHGALLDPESVERFRRESRAAARLHHTNIVQVFGTGEQDGLRYFVMQLVRGPGLDAVVDELVRRDGPAGPQPSGTTPGNRDSALDAAVEGLLSGRFAGHRPESGGGDRTEENAPAPPADPARRPWTDMRSGRGYWES